MLLKCPRCGYIWSYGGEKDRANCPVCHGTIYSLEECLATFEEYKEQLRDEYRQRLAMVREGGA